MKDRIKRESLTEQIKSILIERIVDGTLSPGDRLKELQLADEFGTSQAPVREAIRSLQALGYVEHKLHVGSLVKTFSKKEIEEAFQIRQALEGHCLMTRGRETQALVLGLKARLDRMSRALPAGDVRVFTEADNGFHRAIIEHSQNNRMLEIWESLKIQLQVIATIAEAAMPLDELHALHLPIVAALEQGEPELAVKHLANHYEEIGGYWKELQ
ncbi:GntR family transcriptional regulator [Desulfospira joergensenii]|uniref:GntR family transcriptional regulator n=1 Tax=Desulfospira joergensenii TaxID=53329 RepID=UPI0003B5DC3B|nr:GntR family transcriptional regulator [Desulfospira joergensenii]